MRRHLILGACVFSLCCVAPARAQQDSSPDAAQQLGQAMQDALAKTAGANDANAEGGAAAEDDAQTAEMRHALLNAMLDGGQSTQDGGESK